MQILPPQPDHATQERQLLPQLPRRVKPRCGAAVQTNSAEVLVIGAGLAGTEAAWQIASAGLPVRLVEMRPVRRSPAHHSAEFAELVCSNSFGALSSDRAAGGEEPAW